MRRTNLQWPFPTLLLGFALLATATMVIPSARHKLQRVVAAWKLPSITGFIVVNDDLEAADFIYVLNGKISVRAQHAAALHARGIAPRILIPRTPAITIDGKAGLSLSDIAAYEMHYAGVPRSAIHIVPYPGGVLSTRDEARALRRHLAIEPALRIIVVTTDYHSGRARRVLSQELRGLTVDVRVSAAPNSNGISPQNWWRSSEGLRTYLREGVKQIGSIFVRW